MASYLNTAANPPIRVMVHKASTPTRYGTNTYIDPLDGAPFIASELTPLERGHVYVYWPSQGRIFCEMSYRCADMETGRQLSGLPSLQAEPPYCVQQIPKNARRHPQAILRHFSLDKADWEIFMLRANQQGWRVEPMSSQLANLAADAEALEDDAADVLLSVKDFENTWLTDLAATAASYKDLSTALDEAVRQLGKIEEEGREVVVQQSGLLNRYNLALSGLVDAVVAASATANLSKLDKTLVQVRAVDWGKLRRQLLHVHQALTMGDKPNHKQFRRSLGEELHLLTQCFPHLQLLKAQEETLIISLVGVEIRVHANGKVLVSGSPANLQAFTFDPDAGEGPEINRRLERIARRKTSTKDESTTDDQPPTAEGEQQE